MGKFTPGPWWIGRTVGGSLLIRPTDKRRGTIASLTDENALVNNEWTQQDYKNAEANARLIAAAPDLYEALQALCNEYGPQTGRMRIDSPRRAFWIAARAALAKVK